MDDLDKKIEELLKSLLSLKAPMRQDAFVPAIKPLSIPKPSIKAPAKIPGGLPPASKKDPVKVAEQLKNPRPGKVQAEILKIEDNGQWKLTKGLEGTPTLPSAPKAPSTKLDKPIAATNIKPPPAPGPKLGTAVSGAVPPARAARLARMRAPIDAHAEGFANHHSPEQKALIHGLNIHDTKPMNGSIAGGAQRATNAGKDLVLKKASDHYNQEERGHLEGGFNSAKREVLFHNMARDYFGMGKHVPATAGFSRNGEDYSAQEVRTGVGHADLKRTPEESLDFEKPSEGPDEFANPNHGKILSKLHQSGDLHKLGLMDHLMGHHDRHSGNYMMDHEGDGLHLIDNGTSFDYKNFDHHHYPAYLRAAGNSNIKGMGHDNNTLHPEAAKWLNGLDPGKAKEMLAAHGHDENSPATQGFLRRLQGLKSAVANGPKHYKNMENLLDQNRLTSSPLHEHEKQEPKW